MTLREALSWTYQTADAHGECDRCGLPDEPLWALPSEWDAEPEAVWLYCRACFTVLCRRAARRRGR